MKRVNDIKKLNPVNAERTGIYRTGNESRFFKAGEQITSNYQFSHKRGERPAKPATARQKES